MKPVTIYHFETYTSAKDSANLFYINKPTATEIVTDMARKTITILTRFKPLAVFAW